MYTPLPMKRSTKYGNNYWEGYSPKIKRDVQFFSNLEYENWLLIENDPDIVDFCEQPLKIREVINGQAVESVFDMWVKRKNGAESFIEVKYSNMVFPKKHNEKTLRVKRQIEVQKKWCEKNGYEHLVHTEVGIRKNMTLLENYKLMASFLRNHQQLSEIDKKRIMNTILKGRVSVETIQVEYGLSVSKVKEAVYWLIYSGDIQSNIGHVFLGPKTEVWVDG